MLKTISLSDLPTDLKKVLSEVGYGQNQYVVEQLGEPTAAIINMDDFQLLQRVKEQQQLGILQNMLADVRARNVDVDADELDSLIEEARRVS